MSMILLDAAAPNPLEGIVSSPAGVIIVICGVAAVLTAVVSVILIKKKNKKKDKGE